MTLEKLIGLSADDWEKMSDQELEALCSQFWPVTRPSAEAKEAARAKYPQSAAKPTRKQTVNDLMQLALQMAQKAGAKVSPELQQSLLKKP